MLPSRIDNIVRNPHGSNDNAPYENVKKTIYSQKADKSFSTGTITEYLEGDVAYQGEFEIDGTFKLAGDLTEQDMRTLKDDFDLELRRLDLAYAGVPIPTKRDDDADVDGASNAGDNCPGTYNPDQADSDGDWMGDVCDPAGGIASG